MFGIFFKSTIAGCLAFFISEIPVVFLNVTWLQFYLGREETRLCAGVSVVTIVTYFFCRILLFPSMFLFVMLPQINFFNPMVYPIMALLFLLYILNCYWFYKLLRKTAKLLPNCTLPSVPCSGGYSQVPTQSSSTSMF